tara:strand:+ start:2709 stop:5171 length:2463 start_codon:yes stop_codon:yes gene_type:complete
MNYDFIEIGTSDFETLIQSSTNEIGLSIDAVNLYLNRLPNKETVTKLNYAISNYSGITQVYYVEPEDIESNNLSWYLKGCNSIGEPHPITLRELKEKNLEHLLKADEVEVLTWKDLVERYNIESVKTLKIDAEGHDTIIVNNILEGGHNVYPGVIIFEANELTPDSVRLETIQNAIKVGYSFIEFNTKKDVILKYTPPTDKKILLISSWMGPLPDYYDFHQKTLQFQNSNIDIYLFTDQDVPNQNLSSNYHIIKTTEEEVKSRLFKIIKTEYPYTIISKPLGFKLLYLNHFWSDIIDYSKYDYVGIYDIDTLFGDIYNFISPYLENTDFISIGGKKYHHRLSGPFCLFRNSKKIIDLIYNNDYYSNILKRNINYLEHTLSNLALNKFKTKIITHSQNLDEDTAKVLYDAEWVGGKTYCNGVEIMVHHFYNKPTTKLSFRGNSIISEQKKVYVTDFYWVTHFTENYEPLLKVLINSIKNFSNRKCILYTINYTSPLAYKLSDQFIVRRLDIELGELNSKGKYDNVLSLKPSILSDVTDFIPDSKFVYVDTDIALTINADSITKYFDQLENFPLINSHTHDLITVRGIVDGEEWSSPLNILGEATGVPIYVYPRRKTNVIVFDKNCKWFFDEQVELFQQYRGTRQGIFALHDEDSANLLLNKYNYTKCLPLVDMEEIPNIDMEKFHNYSYSAASVSSNLVLPKHENDVLVFHGFKNPDFENKLKDNYYKTVLAQDDYRLFFERDCNKFWWYKNSNFESKNIKPQVKFEILQNNKIIRSFEEQNIFKYWGIFIGDCDYPPGVYELRITETETGRTLHKDLIEI